MSEQRSTRYTQQQASWAAIFAYSGRIIETEQEVAPLPRALANVGEQQKVEIGKQFKAPSNAAQQTTA